MACPVGRISLSEPSAYHWLLLASASFIQRVVHTIADRMRGWAISRPRVSNDTKVCPNVFVPGQPPSE